MPILTYNASWMIYNCFLAFIPLIFGYFFIKVQSPILKTIYGFLWLIFLPNTIYIFTDLEHLIFQWNHIALSLQPLLLAEYILLEFFGLTVYVLSLFPLEKLLKMHKSLKKRMTLLIILFNFLVAFGMVLGRVERINSWEIFTNPHRVITSAIHVFVSFDLFGLTILFGFLCNFIYFLFRKSAKRLSQRFFDVSD